MVLSGRVEVAPEKLLGVMGVVDFRWAGAVGLAQPSAVGDCGAPFPTAGPAVVATAREKQLVGIGPAAVGPVRCMVDLAAIAWFKAIGAGASAVAGTYAGVLWGAGRITAA